MNEFKKQILEKRIEKVIIALKKNNMNAFYAKDETELFGIIDSLCEGARDITQGGSLTLNETGVINHLKEKFPSSFRCRADIAPEETDRYYREVFSSDVFLASTNAVTENGELFNIDGTGNRVSAMIFGPKKVILVVGSNKIVADLHEAQERVSKLSAPANALRLGIETSCSKCGECVNCDNDNRICCSYVTLRRQRIPMRINVIFLADEYGL